MNEATDSLILARQAYEAHDWAAAAARFGAIGAERLTADDLAAYADSTWGLGRAENLRVQAAAYEAFLADARPAGAGWAAILLGLFHMGRGDVPPRQARIRLQRTEPQ